MIILDYFAGFISVFTVIAEKASYGIENCGIFGIANQLSVIILTRKNEISYIQNDKNQNKIKTNLESYNKKKMCMNM